MENITTQTEIKPSYAELIRLLIGLDAMTADLEKIDTADINAVVSLGKQATEQTAIVLKALEEVTKQIRQQQATTQNYVKKTVNIALAPAPINSSVIDFRVGIVVKIIKAFVAYNNAQEDPSQKLVITPSLVSNFSLKYLGSGFGGGRLTAGFAQVPELATQPQGRSNKHIGTAQLPVVMDAVYILYQTI